MAEEEGAYMLLTNCPPCFLSLKKGLELMQESGEPMEFGIFYFYRVFSRAFVEGGMGQRGLEWKQGDVVTDPGLENPKGIYVDAHVILVSD